MNKNNQFTTLLIELNQICNLDCAFCFYRDYGRVEKYLQLNVLKKITKRFPDLNNFFLTGGECTLHKNILSIIEYLSNKGKVSIFTNGYLIESNFEKYTKIEKLVHRCFLTIHECDNSKVIYKNIYDSLDKEKTIIKININSDNLDNITSILDTYISKGFHSFSFNYIHNIFSNKINYAVEIEKLEELLKSLKKYDEYIDLDNMYMQLQLIRGDADRSIGLCGKSFIYVNCMGEIFNCPSAMNNDIYCNCGNCKMPMAECVSLLEIFKGE